MKCSCISIPLTVILPPPLPGNICRSPMAEAVFDHIVSKAGIRDQFGQIDSCGTGAYHEGEEPDERCVRYMYQGADRRTATYDPTSPCLLPNRTVAVLSKKNIPCNSLARAVTREDFSTFDYIFGM